MSRERTIVFMDNSNIFHGQKDAGWRIDAKKLHKYLERDGGRVWQVHFFASVIDPPRYEETNFYHFIKSEMRYEVTLFKLGRKTHKCRNCSRSWTTYIEKGVDVALATKLLTLANAKAFDTAILIGADKDFLGTVRAVKALGLRVEIFAWRNTISHDMEDESSAPVVYFDDIRREVEMTTVPDLEAEKEMGEEPSSEEEATATE